MDCSIAFRMRRVFGMHNDPAMPQGEFRWRNGPTMAAANFFEIKITGRGAHGAYPHYGIDPIVAGSALVSALQTVVSRSIDPYHPAVVTVGSFQAGMAANVIPHEAVLRGTARWFNATWARPSNGTSASWPRALPRVMGLPLKSRCTW